MQRTSLCVCVTSRAFRSDEVVYSETFIPTASEVVYTLVADVAGEFHVLFTTESDANEKRVYLDNISVHTSSDVVMEFVTSVEGVEACSHLFDNLEAGCRYSYRVQGADGYGASDFSSFETVSLLPLSIEDSVADADFVEVYTLGGIKLYNGRMDGFELAGGIYLVKSGTKAFKAVVR